MDCIVSTWFEGINTLFIIDAGAAVAPFLIFLFSYLPPWQNYPYLVRHNSVKPHYVTVKFFWSSDDRLCRAYLKDDGLVQERRNSSALAVELRLSCVNPLMRYGLPFVSSKLDKYSTARKILCKNNFM